ncbi:hypothetical protein V8F33_012121 [Rhypophila sp. PSN 637]
MAPITFVQNPDHNDWIFAGFTAYCIFAVVLAGVAVTKIIKDMNKPDSPIPRDCRALAACPSFGFTAGFLIRCCGKGAAGTVEGGNGSGGAARNSNAGVVNQPPTADVGMELPSYHQAVGSKQRARFSGWLATRS